MTGDKVDELLARMAPDERELVLKHLDSGTSTDWLASVLTDHGYKVAPSTLRVYRRRRKERTDGTAADRQGRGAQGARG